LNNPGPDARERLVVYLWHFRLFSLHLLFKVLIHSVFEFLALQVGEKEGAVDHIQGIDHHGNLHLPLELSKWPDAGPFQPQLIGVEDNREKDMGAHFFRPLGHVCVRDHAKLGGAHLHGGGNGFVGLLEQELLVFFQKADELGFHLFEPLGGKACLVEAGEKKNPFLESAFVRLDRDGHAGGRFRKVTVNRRHR